MQQRSIFARSETDRISRNALLPYLLFFFAVGFGGWLWEVLVYWVQHSGEYSLSELLAVYRGVLHGPWAPIYGVGRYGWCCSVQPQSRARCAIS